MGVRTSKVLVMKKPRKELGAESWAGSEKTGEGLWEGGRHNYKGLTG
jgi:hypothetical protein